MQMLYARLLRAFQWRWKRYARPRMLELRIGSRWLLAGTGKPHGLPSRLIVSLTSYPARFPALAWNLRSLLRQTVRADETVLWVAHQDMALLPKEVVDLQSAGLKILATEDIRSYKKIVPALEAYPEAYICTADDDVYYHPSWLQEMVQAARSSALVVGCHRAHEITVSEAGRYRPYSEWKFDVPPGGPSRRVFPTGVGGVLYPPGSLAHTQADLQVALGVCGNRDDIWLYWIGRRNGVAYQVVGGGRKVIEFENDRQTPLWEVNVLQGKNDEAVLKMAELYGYPPLE